VQLLERHLNVSTLVRKLTLPLHAISDIQFKWEWAFLEQFVHFKHNESSIPDLAVWVVDRAALMKMVETTWRNRPIICGKSPET
jgi:hypothetical protein